MSIRFIFLVFACAMLAGCALATDIDIDIDSPDIDIDFDPLPYHGNEVSVLYVGPTTMELQDKNLKLEGTTVGFTSYHFRKAVTMNGHFGYRHAKYRENLASGQSIKYSVYMPEVSSSLDINIFGLPTIRRLFSFDSPLKLIAGGGVGASYQPYNMVIEDGTAATPSLTANPFFPNESDKNKWYWNHSTWNIHVFGGFLIDNQVGGVFSMTSAQPMTGDHNWEITDIRFGLAYNL
ncbi:MAG: hypothetical protein OEM52_09365 [bacterium]|nr:hypothetical protein [bacterium]